MLACLRTFLEIDALSLLWTPVLRKKVGRLGSVSFEPSSVCLQLSEALVHAHKALRQSHRIRSSLVGAQSPSCVAFEGWGPWNAALPAQPTAHMVRRQLCIFDRSAQCASLSSGGAVAARVCNADKLLKV